MNWCDYRNVKTSVDEQTADDQNGEIKRVGFREGVEQGQLHGWWTVYRALCLEGLALARMLCCCRLEIPHNLSNQRPCIFILHWSLKIMQLVMGHSHSHGRCGGGKASKEG